MTLLDVSFYIASLLYVFLAARENVWCWFWGIISCTIWAWASYQGALYADVFLQLFYIVISFWGIYQWQNKNSNHKKTLVVRELSWKTHTFLILSGVLLSLPFGYFLKEYTYAAATYLDSLTTVFAIITTFLVTQKILSNWLYWIVIDLVYIYLYASRAMTPQALIMLIYTGMAVWGYFKWKESALKRSQPFTI